MAVSIKNEHCMRLAAVRTAVAGWAASISTAVMLASVRRRRRDPAIGSPPTGAAIVPGRRRDAPDGGSWQQVPGWQDDSLIGATAALRQNCVRLARRRLAQGVRGGRADSTIST